jgi:translocation and assembly module TamB
MARPMPATPEQREARIAELRARRRARMRTLAVRSALGTGALLLVLAALGYWVLMTLAGRQFLLAQLVARLPAGTELSWQRADGPAAGPLQLHGLRLVVQTCPERDGESVPYGQCERPMVTTFSAHRVLLDADIRPLFGRLLRLDVLEVEGATLDLARDEAPFEFPRWPDVLPELDIPLGLQVDTLVVDGLAVSRAGESLIDVASIRGAIDARPGRLQLERVRVDSDRGLFQVDGDYVPAEDFATGLTASALLPARHGSRARLGLAARGDLQSMRVAIRGVAPAPLSVDLGLQGGERPRWMLRAGSKALQPAALIGGAAGAPLAFSVTADGIGGEAEVRGRLRREDLVAVLQPSSLRLQDQVLELKPLIVDIQGGRMTVRGRADFSGGDDAGFRLALRARGLSFGGNAPATPGEGSSAGIGPSAVPATS